MAGHIVDGVLLPCVAVEINVLDEHAMCGSISIPTLLLVVLEQVVLPGELGVVVPDEVCYGLLSDGRHVIHVAGLCEFYGCEPSAIHALVAGEGSRSLAVAVFTVVRTIVHQIPHVHAEVLSIGARIVHVGDGQAVAELMAGCANAVHLVARGAAQLAGAGIGVDGDSVDGEGTRAVIVLGSL